MAAQPDREADARVLREALIRADEFAALYISADRAMEAGGSADLGPVTAAARVYTEFRTRAATPPPDEDARCDALGLLVAGRAATGTAALREAVDSAIEILSDHPAQDKTEGGGR